MKIALVGTRGIPAGYSGFETAVENLAREFVKRGHEVVVYCRPHMVGRQSEHVGARLVHLPTVANKYLDTIVHTALSTAHLATRERPDVAIYFISGNAPMVPFARLAGIPAILQIDGLDSERAKWPGPAKAYIRFAERISPRVATVCVTDSETVAEHYAARYGRRIGVVTYGASLPDPGTREAVTRLGLTEGRFVLFVGRLVPENNAHLLVDAYRQLDTDWPLVIVGDAPYSEAYIAELKASGGPNVLFPGYVFGAGYAELVHGCGVMVAPTEVGGTHPVIIEGMAAGACMVVSDHGPNVEVVGDSAATFALSGGAAALAETLRSLMVDDARRTSLGQAAASRAAERYAWRRSAEEYLEICERVAR
jgi:glycosyltransferase involved in cell wall biosynthesis